jgi:acyl-CoA reductase-like NAD-dependent aldehyde dehydrogenase
MTVFSMTIGGKSAVSGKTFNVVNPADESVVATCPEGTVELVDEAVASARAAFRPWSRLPDAERVSKLLAIADLIEKHHPELSQLITREQGKTQSGPGAKLEVGGAAAWTRATAGLSLPEETIQDDRTGKIVMARKPATGRSECRDRRRGRGLSTGQPSEEQFGPVIPLVRYKTVEEAIERANALEVGLGGSVWGNDPTEAARYARELECGTAWANQHGTLHPMAPFGGVKCSGIGVEFNVDGLKEYTTVQVVNVAL